MLLYPIYTYLIKYFICFWYKNRLFIIVIMIVITYYIGSDSSESRSRLTELCDVFYQVLNCEILIKSRIIHKDYNLWPTKIRYKLKRAVPTNTFI